MREAAEVRVRQLVIAAPVQGGDDDDGDGLSRALTTEVEELCRDHDISVNLRTEALRRWTLLQV